MAKAKSSGKVRVGRAVVRGVPQMKGGKATKGPKESIGRVPGKSYRAKWTAD